MPDYGQPWVPATNNALPLSRDARSPVDRENWYGLLDRDYEETYTDLATLAAAYAFGMAKNRPFVDGNKRAALVSAYTFLALNDLELEAPEPETVTVILGLSDDSLSEDESAAWVRGHLVPWAD